MPDEANLLPAAAPVSCSACHGTEDLRTAPMLTRDTVTLVCHACAVAWYEGACPRFRCDGVECGHVHTVPREDTHA